MATDYHIPNDALPDNHWDRPDPFVIQLLVTERHIDALGHTNNVHYLSWLQLCAWEHSKSRGFSESAMVKLDRAMVVRETQMQYLAATFAGDELQVGDWIVDTDRRLRASRGFQIVRVADQVCIMRARINYICMRISSGRPCRMPPEYVSAYADDLRN